MKNEMSVYKFEHAACGLEIEASSLEAAFKTLKTECSNLSDGHGNSFEWYDIHSVKENDSELDPDLIQKTIKKVGY